MRPACEFTEAVRAMHVDDMLVWTIGDLHKKRALVRAQRQGSFRTFIFAGKLYVIRVA